MKIFMLRESNLIICSSCGLPIYLEGQDDDGYSVIKSEWPKLDWMAPWCHFRKSFIQGHRMRCELATLSWGRPSHADQMDLEELLCR